MKIELINPKIIDENNIKFGDVFKINDRMIDNVDFYMLVDESPIYPSILNENLTNKVLLNLRTYELSFLKKDEKIYEYTTYEIEKLVLKVTSSK